MARPIRIEVPGGKYYVTVRGKNGLPIFQREKDRVRFLDSLSRLSSRLGVRVHAYVLMDDHYHLLVETPEANLSRWIRSLNVSYSRWLNRRHRRTGAFVQGRFKAILIADGRDLQRVARYLHLNPVAVKRPGLDRKRRRASASNPIQGPSAHVVGRGLEILRQYPWSSYRAAAGYRKPPGWLWLKALHGGRSGLKRIKELRQYTEEAVREGLIDNPWEGLVRGVILGSKKYARQQFKYAQQQVKQRQREQRKKALQPPPPEPLKWEQIVKAVERAKGERWASFQSRYGDWGRDAALWLGRRGGRMRIAALLARVKGSNYGAVAAAVSRFGKRLAEDRELAKQFAKIQKELSKFQR